MKKMPTEPMKVIAKPMQRIATEPMKAIAKPMQRIATKPMKRVVSVPVYVPTTDEDVND